MAGLPPPQTHPGSSEGPSGAVASMLLQEAQAEVASLRSDLYATRRLAEERRVALADASAKVEALTGRVADLSAQLAEATAGVRRLSGVEGELAHASGEVERLAGEVAKAVAAKRVLQGELADERAAREALQQAKASGEAERARLAGQRDAAQAAARLAEARARDAEYEQVGGLRRACGATLGC
eukprot:350616-Chlamydomonas_euryale.AAC.2